jgi:signal transduction histidine kinase
MNTYEILSKVIDITNASVDAERRLMNLVETLALIFSVPLCALFLWDPQQARLFLKYCNRSHPALPEGLSFSADEGPLGASAQQRIPIILDDASQLFLGAPRTPENFASFHFLAAFPIVDDISLYGVLALLGENPRPLSEEEHSLLPVICRQLAGTIRRAQFSLQAKKRIAELTTLHSIGMAISSISELGELLNRITLSSAKLLQADGSILRLLDEEGGALKVVSSFGLEHGANSLNPVQLGEDVAGIVALTGEPILLPDVKRSPYSFTTFSPLISSVVCVPLIFKSKTIGTLALFSNLQEGYPKKIFDEEDKDLLATMASQIASAIENAIILQRAEILAKDKESALRELSLLYKVSGSMLTTTKLDQLLRIILISVTLGNQRGFDRAALFLVDEKENVLQGMMGVGARERGEVDHWRQKLAEQDIFSPDWVFPEEMERTPYDLRVRQARVSVDEEHSILVRTVREKRSFNVENATSDPDVNPRILGWFGSQAFASVPLIAKEKVIGLIAVDNLLSERPITSGDMGFLTLLANQAALAIENSRLYGNLQEMNTQLLQTQSRLIQSEKLAALGEVVASITHEIKNPLVSIGGFARRLDRHFQESSPEKKYMRILIKEVKRLESILNETLAFSKEPSTSFAQSPLNRIIEDALFILEGEIQERNISVMKELARNLPPLLSDPQQMKQVFLNLFVNALQAMGKDGQLSVKTSVQRRNERQTLQVEVADTGGGIRLEILDNIFNPFFTTKHDGTGLGLAIAHKIITQHRGEIEVINHPGVGATFLIRFPLPE